MERMISIQVHDTLVLLCNNKCVWLKNSEPPYKYCDLFREQLHFDSINNMVCRCDSCLMAEK